MTRQVRALVIEDNLGDLEYISTVLHSVGHDFDATGSQAEATKLLDKHDYDYMLLDREIPVQPEGIKRVQNGDNLFEQIKRQPRLNALRVIIITAHDVEDPDQAVEMIKQGAFDFIAKPFSADRRRTLDKVIQRAASGLAAFHPAWQTISLMEFIRTYCLLPKEDSAKRCKARLVDAIKHNRIIMPPTVGDCPNGATARYFTRDLVAAWQEFRHQALEIPPLRPEISALF